MDGKDIAAYMRSSFLKPCKLVPVEFFSSSYAGNKFSSQYQVIH